MTRRAATAIRLALVRAARHAVFNRAPAEPKVGDLVVEITGARKADPDGLGYLVAHGEAAINRDGTGARREVWDIRPVDRVKTLRWENAEFAAVPAWFRDLVETLFPPV